MSAAELDLGDLAAVRRYALKASKRGESFDVVVLNAAIAGIVPNDEKTGLNPLFLVTRNAHAKGWKKS